MADRSMQQEYDSSLQQASEHSIPTDLQIVTVNDPQVTGLLSELLQMMREEQAAAAMPAMEQMESRFSPSYQNEQPRQQREQQSYQPPPLSHADAPQRRRTDSDEAYPLDTVDTLTSIVEKAFASPGFHIQSQGARNELRNVWQSERAGDILQSGFGVGKGAGGMMEETKLPIVQQLGTATKFVMGFGENISKSVEGLRSFNDNLHSANMRFAQFSASMAIVEANQEVRDILLSQKRGERRAESAEYLAEGRNQLEQKMARIEDATANIKNWLTGYFDRTITRFIEKAEKWLNMQEKEEEGENLNMNEWVDVVANDNWDMNHGRPERMPGAPQPRQIPRRGN